MKIADLLGPIMFGLLLMWGMQFFFGTKEQPRAEEFRSGQRVTAPAKRYILEPLNLEIDFLDKDIGQKGAKRPKKVLTQVATKHARYEFSTEGASLCRVEFLRNWAGKDGYLGTIFPPTETEKEQSAFLVALDQPSPFYFDLVEHKEDAQQHTIAYKAQFEGGTLFKNFVVSNDSYRIDLTISLQFDGKKEQLLVPRVLFPAPFVPELQGQDTITGIMSNEKNNLAIAPQSEQLFGSYWVRPTLFGAQDRYFVHAVTQDHDAFCQRGYYKLVDQNFFAIAEGPSVKSTAGEHTTWTISFYVGPKEDDALIAVDPRLEQTLNYGWFAFIFKPLSKWTLDALNFINNYANNYGIAIILLTILIKLFLFPFTFRAEEDAKKRSAFQKKLEHAEKKYKNDPQARADLIREHGMPGLGKMLLMPLLQMPVFWALSITLSNAIELYKAPFLWISDLSIRDPYYILPVLFAFGIMLHGVTQATGKDPKQHITSVVMGIVVAALLSNFASGLLIYIVMSTVLSIGQSFIVRWLKLV